MKATVKMADGKGLNTAQLLFFLAVIALIVGIVFHVIYLVKDRSAETAQDTWTAENAKMFFLMGILLATVAWIVHGMQEKRM